MKIKTVRKYNETDQNGEHEVIEQSNGISIKSLKIPSKEYKEKTERMKVEQQKRKEAQKIIVDKEKKIKDKMREIAIRELKESGELDG